MTCRKCIGFVISITGQDLFAVSVYTIIFTPTVQLRKRWPWLWGLILESIW